VDLKKTRETVWDAMLTVGLGLILCGAWSLSRAWAVIVAGAILAGLAGMLARRY